eukprot:jgi/Astpho2/2140/Aster-03134
MLCEGYSGVSVMISPSALLEPQFKVDILRAGQEDVVQSSTRRDPTNGFKAYTGGFNLRSRSYVASVAFVGLPGYVIGVFCLLAAIFFYLLRCCCCCCCHRGFCLHPSASGYNRGQRWIPKVMILLASLVAVLGAAIVLVSGADLKRDLNNLSNVLVDTVNQVIALFVVAGVAAVVVLIALVASCANLKGLLLGPLAVVPLLLLVGWVMFGVGLAASAFTSDLCTEAASYGGPSSNSSLAKIVPCADATAGAVAVTSGVLLVEDLVLQINDVLNRTNSNSGRNLSLVCVPYTGTGQLIASTCPYPSASYSTPLSSFSAAYGPLACTSNITAICNANQTYISAANYANASGLASSSQAVIANFPILQYVISCQYATATFNAIASGSCGAMRVTDHRDFEHLTPAAIQNDFNFMWTGFIVISAPLTILALLWLIGFQRFGRSKSSQDQRMKEMTKWDNAAAGASEHPQPQTAVPFTGQGIVPAPQLPMSQQRYIPLRPRGRPPADQQ